MQDYSELPARVARVRAETLALLSPLSLDEMIPQSMPDASPAKWHAGHTTWFWETMVLAPHAPGYRPFSKDDYGLVFNSYYVALGSRFKRDARQMIVRPTVEEVFAYRKYVDAALSRFLWSLSVEKLVELAPLIEIALNHEQQHQELILTDLKHLLYQNPFPPTYQTRRTDIITNPAPPVWGKTCPAGLYDIGVSGAEFAFDNERPHHKTYVESFQLATRSVINLEFKEFIRDNGYNRPELWLAEGYALKEANGWEAPLYWMKTDGVWEKVFTLTGVRDLEPYDPVCHVSFYEADAFARWSHARLPSEAEWEITANTVPLVGQFLESAVFHPTRDGTYDSREKTEPVNMFGSVWEWTQSPYRPYPGFTPLEGALGEYNGKFMINQMVLRGGSCATPASHIRASYRNFFPPDARWQFSGIRLAKDV